MKTNISIVVAILLLVFLSCASKPGGDERMVLIKTEFGNMKVKLYNETPLHRDNFVHLVEEGFYDNLLFHRVIKGFMIQGGDPDSKDAPANKRLGSGGPDYTIDAEFVPKYCHKKGALSAARQGDQTNPEKKSSGSQFYVVQGKTYTNEEIDQFAEKQRFQAVRAESMKLFQEHRAEYNRLRQEGKLDSANTISVEVQEKAEAIVDAGQFAISEERREIYSTIGGTPHLDDSYTVFGEVVEGLDIIDSIANVQTGSADRPVDDVQMTMEMLN